VVLGALGKREAEIGETALSEAERTVVRQQVVRVIVQATLIGVVATAAVWVI
jgi:hypothetical protein